jgi:hypothetical protein
MNNSPTVVQKLKNKMSLFPEENVSTKEIDCWST